MANVTYLIGAGASAGKRGRDLPNGDPKDNRIIEGLPCVNEIPTCLYNLIFDIKRHNFSQEYDTIKGGLLERLEKLYRMSERHATIDTYAKKLKLKKDNLEFQQTEMMLAYFFMVEQLIHKPDSRYDTFFANILDNQLDIPENINIISWNYDSQFEIAYQEYEADRSLPITFKGAEYPIDTPKIFKVNGTAAFENLSNIALLRGQVPPFENGATGMQLSSDGVKFLLDLYKRISQPTKKLNTRLSFAFDDTTDDTMFEQINKVMLDTNVLVIIGYTFPFFNRKIDRKILSHLRPFAKIYIQDLSPQYVRQSLQAVLTDIQRNMQIKELERTDQFYLPSEL